MNTKLAQLKNDLIATFPDIKICGTTSDFYGHKEQFEGLWVSGEESWDKDGFPLFTLGGENEKLNEILEQHGFFFDFYDSGTVMIYEN